MGPGARLLLAVMLVIAATSCAAGSPQEPTTPPTPASLRPTVPPPVPRPLDASRFAGDRICELLSNEQAASLGSLDDTPSPFSIGSNFHECARDQSGPRSPSVVIHYKLELELSHSFLEYLYETSRTQEEFTSLTISGQPAVRYSITEISGKIMSCDIALILAEQQSVRINVSAMRDSCDLAVAVAEQIVHNLGG